MIKQQSTTNSMKFIFWVIALASVFFIFVRAYPNPEQGPFYLPDDLEITLWAESPMFFNPTNIDTDYRGRIWVAEAVNYRNPLHDSTSVKYHTGGDRIVILEDTDQDGKADKSTVFVQDSDLVSPLGIAVVGNKVIVSCSPKIIVYTDEDGDDKPDKKEVLLRGFGGRDHDHGLHSLTVGPDGKWYFNVGNAGPHHVVDKSGWMLRSGSVYTDGAPPGIENKGGQVSDDNKIWVGGLQLRVNPDGTGLTVLGHNFRNSYESCIDSYGDMWQNDNDDQTAACRCSWLPEQGNAGYFNEDGTRFWYLDQRPGQDMLSAHWHQEDPGVMPAGDIYGAGAPTGILINEGDGLGEAYRGLLLSADAGRNSIFSYPARALGSGFQLEGLRKVLLSSTPIDDPGYVWADPVKQRDTTKWFRPSDILIGADGALYIADWYDPVVGGHQMKDKKGIGRIYRVAPKGRKLKVPLINISTLDGQITALKSPAVNVRWLGLEALKARGEKSIDPLRALLKAPNPYHQARALFLLSQLGEKGQSIVEALLIEAQTNARLRVAAFRALRSQYTAEKLLGLAMRLLPSADASLRREITMAVADSPLAQRRDILLQIVEKFDGNDPWLLEAIGICVGQDAELLWPEILSRINSGPNSAVATLALAWRLHPLASVAYLRGIAQAAQSSMEDRRKAITGLAFIRDKKAVETMSALAQSELSDVAEQARYWLAFRQSNDWLNLWNWETAVVDVEKELSMARQKAGREKILNNNIALWDRKATLRSMAVDSFGGQLLLDLACDNKLPAALLRDLKANIFNNPDLSVRVRAGNCIKRPGAAVMLSPEAIASLKGDPVKGKQAYQSACATCHTSAGSAPTIGPDLTGIGAKLGYFELLDAIINPGAGIAFGYETWSVQTKSGDSYYGFLGANGQNVIIRDLSGKQQVIPEAEVLSKKRQTGSIMPDALALSLTEQQLADITIYLTTLK